MHAFHRVPWGLKSSKAPEGVLTEVTVQRGRLRGHGGMTVWCDNRRGDGKVLADNGQNIQKRRGGY